jgi:hypothetical protein
VGYGAELGQMEVADEESLVNEGRKNRAGEIDYGDNGRP